MKHALLALGFLGVYALLRYLAWRVLQQPEPEDSPYAWHKDEHRV